MTGTFDVFDIKLSNMSSSSGSMLLSCLLYVGTCIFEVLTSGCTFVLVNFLTLLVFTADGITIGSVITTFLFFGFNNFSLGPKSSFSFLLILFATLLLNDIIC